MPLDLDLGRLQPETIEYVIDDLDNCLFLYPEGFAEQFSVETAKSSHDMARDLFATGRDDTRIVDLLETDIETLTQKAIQSYEDHRCTTTIFARDYGLNSVELYRAHHKSIVEKDIKTSFNRFASHGLRQGAVMLRNLGVRQYVFTNATEYYAEEATKALGIHDCYNALVGIDSVNDLDFPKEGKVLLLPKHVRQAWYDFLQHTQIKSTTGYAIGHTERPKKPQDWKYSNCLFMDDSLENLKIAKMLGMQTVLRLTDRVSISEHDKSYIDAMTNNPAVFKCLLADAIEKSRPVVASAPRLVYSK